MMFARVLILLYVVLNLGMIKDGKRWGGANKSMTLRPRVSQLERLSLFLRLIRPKPPPAQIRTGDEA